jgi:vacuolar-type H+-ATPase subunit I/STV1
MAGKQVQNLALQNYGYQDMEFDLPVGGILIRFYYRYFKQNRYQLPLELTKKICNLLKDNFVKEGGHIDFSCMKPMDKADLTHEEQCQRLLSQQERALPVDQKEALRREYFERMDSVIFHPDRGKGKLYFDEILQSYIICRRAMIDKIHQLERACREIYKITRNDGECYTNFNVYANRLVYEGYIDETEQAKLIKIRNAAFHGDIPAEEYMPQDFLKKVNSNPDRSYFDYFGEGIALIRKILETPTFKQKSKGLTKNQRKQ